jgi:hypothetical protein
MAQKNFVFIINCRKNLLSWLSDFETNAISGSSGSDNYDNS